MKMRTETRIIVLLLLLAPALSELVTGNAPPLVFFLPHNFIFLLLGYGCGTLLIREAKARWKLQWSVIFLSVAYAIVEEGLMTKAFFNVAHAGGSVLSGYGMFLGVQWFWAIGMIVYHSTISTLVPIAMVGLLWPKFKDKPLLGRNGFILCLIGLASATLLGMATIGTNVNGTAVPYYPNPLLLIGSFIAVLALVWLAYHNRGRRIASRAGLYPPLVFGVIGFVFQLLNHYVPIAMVGLNVQPLTALAIYLIVIGFAVLFASHQIFNLNASRRHFVALITGSVLYYILLASMGEFMGKAGMFVVDIIALLSLMLWRRKVLKVYESRR